MGKRYGAERDFPQFQVAGTADEMPDRALADTNAVTTHAKLDYIATMARELQGMSADCGCATLSGLFQLCWREARLRGRI